MWLILPSRIAFVALSWPPDICPPLRSVTELPSGCSSIELIIWQVPWAYASCAGILVEMYATMRIYRKTMNCLGDCIFISMFAS